MKKQFVYRVWLLLPLVLFGSISERSLFAQSEYRFQHFSTKDGLADDFAWSIKQDSLGYIWVQYYGGLSRFDGHNFKVYKYDQDDSRRSSLDFLLGELVQGPNKQIWVSQHGHPPRPPFTLARYDQKTDGFVKFTAPIDYNFLNTYRVDNDGRTLWLSRYAGQGLQSWNMETKEIVSYMNPSSDEETYKRRNTLFDTEEKGGAILVGTQAGLWSFDKATKTFNRPACNPRDSSLLYHAPIYFIGDKESFWILTDRAMVKLAPDLSVLHRIDFPPNFPFRSFAVASDGVVWVATWTEGIYRYNPADSSFLNIRNVPGDPHSLNTNAVNDILIDRDQNVWVANEKGISKLLRKNLTFVNIDLRTAGEIIYKTKNKDFLVARKYDEVAQESAIFIAPIIPERIDQLQFKKILSPIDGNDLARFFQGKNHLWISTRVGGGGIYGLPINANAGMIDVGAPLRFRHSLNSSNTIETDDIGAIWEDSEETLWAGDVGLSKIDTRIPYGEQGSVTRYKNSEADSNSVRIHQANQIYPEDENSFWVLDSEGVDLFHRDTQQFEHVFTGREIADFLYRTSDGSLFLGTGKGLYKGNKQRGHYRFEDAPLWSKSEVTAMQEDRLGRLWLYSRIGPVCYDPKDDIAIEFNENDGALHATSIERGHLHQTSQGVMIMADPKGLSFFDPLTLVMDRKKIRPVLTKLEVNDKAPQTVQQPGREDDFLISSDISVLQDLTLDYKHNNFSIEFSAMEMTAPEKNLYRYKLEGYNTQWIETDFRDRTATYTNLDAGDYTFKVKASNHHGIWSDEETTLAITVLPPPWKSGWAYAGYGLLFVALLVFARRSIVQRERLKSNLKLEKVEREKEHFELEKAKEVDKVKSTFFANISHEFRTPLTLIKGPVQEMLEEFADHPKVKERLKLVQRNADLVLKLINQLLDLAKLESGNLSIEKSENDLNSFLRVVTNSFSSLAFQKGITLETELPTPRLVSFDKDKVETILINLINNALKFTPAGGRVTIKTEVKNNQPLTELQTNGTPLGEGLSAVGFAKAEGRLKITVSDTGIGIPADQQSKVFERFHQVSEAHKEVGTGIGLSLVKELVALMEGSLTLKSEPGKGSTFTITLPVEVIRVLSETETVVEVKEQLVLEEFPSNGTGQEVEGDTRPRILVVEDNGDLRRFIIDCLGKEFHFLEAGDGKQGMEKAFEETPDLVISDVMMPEMDGITMTGILKKDTRTSHIPLILLTAKTSDESKLSGLGTGADDYLTKPFNKNELLLKVRNSIAMRVKLREKIKLELLKESPKVEVQSEDEKFLFKVRESILNRLSDEQLSVESLAEEIGLSRSQLLRKITALTGVSVNELIRTFRLQKAAQLLEQNWGPVTQVAYEVGFSNLSYFSKVFKEQYGVLPSEYPVKTT